MNFLERLDNFILEGLFFRYLSKFVLKIIRGNSQDEFRARPDLFDVDILFDRNNNVLQVSQSNHVVLNIHLVLAIGGGVEMFGKIILYFDTRSADGVECILYVLYTVY